MPFDFLAFLAQEAVPHVVGPAKNVRRNHVGLQCPFCGPSDPGMHFSYNLDTGAYGCWRDSTHRGKNVYRLIQAVKGCNRDTAREIVLDGLATEEVSWEELTERANNLFKAKPRKEGLKRMRFPDDFKPPAKTRLRRPFWDYLRYERGFLREHVDSVVERYGFMCSLAGPHAGRLIIPVQVNGVLIGWTGRTIHDVEPRYKAWPPGDTIKQGLPFYDVVTGFNEGARGAVGNAMLAVVEGGLDAPKLDFYGAEYGLNALPIMGTSATPAQLTLIAKAAKFYERVVVLLDQKAEASAMLLASQLATVGAVADFLPDDVKDPGAFTPRRAEKFARHLVKKWGR
jgi:hypothetical protein